MRVLETRLSNCGTRTVEIVTQLHLRQLRPQERQPCVAGVTELDALQCGHSVVGSTFEQCGFSHSERLLDRFVETHLRNRVTWRYVKRLQVQFDGVVTFRGIDLTGVRGQTRLVNQVVDAEFLRHHNLGCQYGFAWRIFTRRFGSRFRTGRTDAGFV